MPNHNVEIRQTRRSIVLHVVSPRPSCDIRTKSPLVAGPASDEMELERQYDPSLFHFNTSW